MVEWLDANILYWHWIVFGILLAGAEIFAPSFFLLWLGVSGVLVGLIRYYRVPLLGRALMLISEFLKN